MSHLAKIQLQIKDLAALRLAAAARGLELVEGAPHGRERAAEARRQRMEVRVFMRPDMPFDGIGALLAGHGGAGGRVSCAKSPR